MIQLEMKIKTFTHDTYIYDLPPNLHDQFYSEFPFYQKNFDYQKKQIQFAPIVRIYGTNQYGQKCCCHVHGFFPYFYIKCQQFSDILSNQQQRNRFIKTTQQLYQKAHGVAKPIIYRSQIQQRFDFYGYHSKKQKFLKIILYDHKNIRPLWELLGSKIIGNKQFQCYQGHISYFMQMFTELNLYGIHEMRICGFTFRKHKELMQLFQKINPNLSQGIMQYGWNLSELQQKKPQYFNNLYKLSPCYLEIDLSLDSILNSYQLESERQSQIDSSDQQAIKQKLQRKMSVKITKSLGQIWHDQKMRRLHMNIQQPLYGSINYSKNIQATQQIKKGIKDPFQMIIGNIDYHQKFSKAIQMCKSYLYAPSMIQNNNFTINNNVIQNYNNVISQRNQGLIEAVEQRWSFYQKRKRRIISQLMKGEATQLPIQNMLEDEQSSGQDIENDNDDDAKTQKGSVKSAFDVLGYKKKTNNTQLYRGLHQVVKPILAKQSLFQICQFCNKPSLDCQCQKIQQKKKQYTKPVTNSMYTQWHEYNVRPPKIQECLQNTALEIQEPYFSNYEDLFEYYKLPKTFSRELKYAQYLDKSLISKPPYYPSIISIRNQLKLPSFWKINQVPNKYKKGQLKYPQTIYLEYIYANPPTKQTLIEQFAQKIQQQHQQYRKVNSSMMVYQQTFISDLVLLKYEILCNSSKLYSNPQTDQIQLMILKVSNNNNKSLIITILLIQQKNLTPQIQNKFDEIIIIKNERSLLLMFANIVFRIDPDILISYDQQKRGIYYLVNRGFAYSFNLSILLSRSIDDFQDIYQAINFYEFEMVKCTYFNKDMFMKGNVINNPMPNKMISQYYIQFLKDKIKENMKKKPILRKKYKYDTINTRGRVNLNLYRLCQFQLKLRCYTLEAVVKHLYNVQLYQFTDQKLFQLFKKQGSFAIDYILERLDYQEDIMQSLNIVGGIVQKSKVYGADFVSMMERGSQFKIQSIMCRVTKQNGYLNLSASKHQVAFQSVLECRPLVLEPSWKLYTKPVLLFDFQSLYPSVMIAYNLCYSTCLGSIKQKFKNGRVKRMGVTDSISMDLQWIEQIFQENSLEQASKKLERYLFVTRNGVVFVRKHVREGIIPRILLQFLISRIMIKNSIKLYKKDTLKRLLKQRQIALKLFMNVMFGYTGASFSGRMPCSQIADSVVQVSKCCLQQSMNYLKNHPKYKGQVIYGDTDSIFFLLHSASFQEAFEIGKKLATQLTAKFPFPIQMKFQKVYQSLVLVSKKRYYGKSYETELSQPKYEGKGLECVRRDNIELTKNLMAQMLNTLFNSKDLSIVKKIFKKNYSQLLSGFKLENQLYLGKEVKLIKYQQKNTPAHGEAAKLLLQLDPMLEPKYGQRMKYLITKNSAKRIKDKSIPLINYQLIQKQIQLDYQYYAENQILNALSRVFPMVNIRQWAHPIQIIPNPLNNNIFIKKHCLNCGKVSSIPICYQCIELNVIDKKIKQYQNSVTQALKICRKCTFSKCNDKDIQDCVQWNCQNLYKRKRAMKLNNKVSTELLKLKQAIQQYNNL